MNFPTLEVRLLPPPMQPARGAIALLCGVAWCVFSSPCWGGSAVVLISGGPCVYDPNDPVEDKNWDCYVSAPLHAESARKIGLTPPQHFFWIVFKPAYEQRWKSDTKAADFRKDHAAKVKEQGFNTYVELIEARAKERKWNLIWIYSGNEFWKALSAIQVPIDELYYWGHARDDLWLTLDHDAKHAAQPPGTQYVISAQDVFRHDDLRLLPQSSDLPSFEFFASDSYEFARFWANTFNVTTYGYEGRIDFSEIYNNGGQVLTEVGNGTPRTKNVIGFRKVSVPPPKKPRTKSSK